MDILSVATETKDESGTSTSLADRQLSYLFVLPWDLSYVGGVDQVVDNLWREMGRDRSFRQLLMVSDWRYPKPFATEVAGRPTIYYRLRDPWSAGSGVRSLMSFLACLPSTLWSLRRLVRKFSVAAVNFHYPQKHALAFVLLRWLGLYQGKIILSFHGTDIAQALASCGTERKIWQLLLRHADTRVAVSESLKSQVLLLAPESSVAVVHNGLDIAGLLARRDHGFHVDQVLRERPFIFCAAAFVDRKGQDILVEAFARIVGEFPDLMLALVGEKKTNDYLSKLRQQIAHHNLQERVILHENVPHNRIAAYYERAQLFVLPSRAEPFGIVLLEAGAFGLPVIASRVGGIPEIITDGENGKLVLPGDVVALAAAISALLNSPGEGRRLGENLRDHVTRNFSWTRAYEKYRAFVGHED